MVPPAILMIAQKVGGLAVGAFDPDGTLVGFVFGLTGLRGTDLVHWSHMLAVRDDRRDQSIGRRLKMHQRWRLRAMGVQRINWTYDPLVARNAHLNLERLGAFVVEYVENMYGKQPLSSTDQVIGTDRFVVEWPLSDEVPRTADHPGESPDAPMVSLRSHGAGQSLPEHPVILIAIPRDIQALKHDDPSAARAWRSLTRRALQYYLSRDYEVVGLAHRAGAVGVAYRLERKAPRV